MADEKFMELLHEPQKWFVFDIETAVDDKIQPEFADYLCKEGISKVLKDPIKIQTALKEEREKFPLSPYTGKIIFASIMTNDEKYFDFAEWNINPAHEGERDLIGEFWEKFNNLLLGGYRPVSKGGKRFDLPYLMFRSLKNNLFPEFGYVKYPDLINKYKHTVHCDLENLFEGSLARIAYAFGISDDFENHGNEIGNMYFSGGYLAIQLKNHNDLRETASIYRKLECFL